MTVSELAKELKCTVSDIQRAARTINMNQPLNPTYALKPDEAERIRERGPITREEANAAKQTQPEKEQPPDNKEQLAALAPPLRTEAPARPNGKTTFSLFIHYDLLDWMTSNADIKLRRRLQLVIRQMFSRGRPNNTKPVEGAGKGWSRTRIGGNHFYLWWAKAGAPPVAQTTLQENQILLRAVRHHDETDKMLDAGRPEQWIPLQPAEVALSPSDEAFPFREEQASAACSPVAVRLLKGHPGTGKTTALYLAAMHIGGPRALYLTYSRRLAAEAENELRTFGPMGTHIDVMTFGELLDALEENDTSLPIRKPDEAAREMEVLLKNFRERWVPWDNATAELYAELHATFVGRALPISFRGVNASNENLSEQDFIKLRKEELGEVAAKSAASVGRFLEENGQLKELMNGPCRARQALRRINDLPARLQKLDAIFVDEVQDLTLIEQLLVIELARSVSLSQSRRSLFVLAGDEGQTVRPTNFEWGPLSDLIRERLGVTPEEHELPGNVRSPRNIAHVVNQSWATYRHLEKKERPRGKAKQRLMR